MQKDTSYTDAELLHLYKHGDNRNYAFNLIIKKFQSKLYQHIRRMVIDHDDTDDILQDTFVKAWNGLENFREESQLFTWLYRIATNEALTFLKKKKNRFFIPIHDITAELENKLISERSINADKLILKLELAILKLPEQQRAVFNMRYYDELKYEQIAEITGVTVGALKASYHHAVKKIEKFIKED
ncbi:MAG: RNA polymerase sigma factor [Bacteroidetes bacterium]|nr:RNA polymerase sigma factor [Bacteroidota bacterium]